MQPHLCFLLVSTELEPSPNGHQHPSCLIPPRSHYTSLYSPRCSPSPCPIEAPATGPWLRLLFFFKITWKSLWPLIAIHSNLWHPPKPILKCQLSSLQVLPFSFNSSWDCSVMSQYKQLASGHVICVLIMSFLWGEISPWTGTHHC